MPMVFCASLVPCIKPIPPALRICIFPKTLLIVCGRSRLESDVKNRHEDKSDNETEQRRQCHWHDHFPQKSFAFNPGFGIRLRPDDDVPIIFRRSQRSSAQSTDQRVTGTGRQPDPPGEKIPNDRADQRANQSLTRQREYFGIDQSRGNRFRNCRSPHCADEIRDRRQTDCLSRRQNFCGNNRCDGICRVMKTVDVFESQRDENHDQNKRHERLGIFKNDVIDHVP